MAWYFRQAIFITLTATSVTDAANFSPNGKLQLMEAVANCISVSARGDCSQSNQGRIGEWDVSQVTDMKKLFDQARSFNADISKWKTSRVTSMAEMFSLANGFNNGISKWDVSNVRDMSGMFSYATSFNADISGWVVSQVQFMQYMFHAARAFNIDISRWDVSRVVSMSNMFNQAVSFTRTLAGAAWVSSQAAKDSMFSGSSGKILKEQKTTTLKTSAALKPRTEKSVASTVKFIAVPITVMTTEPRLAIPQVSLAIAVANCLSVSARGDCSPHGRIGEWDVSQVTDMKKLFARAKYFNADISKWKTSRVTDMTETFSSATLFNGDISNWDVSNVRDMSGMFSYATSFNADISGWVVSQVQFMQYMFFAARAFSVDLYEWDVSRVVSMSNMFNQATSFTHALCGAAWVSSKAANDLMFWKSSGSIDTQVCAPGSRTTASTTTTTTTVTTTTAITSSHPNVSSPTSTYTFNPIVRVNVTNNTIVENIISFNHGVQTLGPNVVGLVIMAMWWGW